MVVAQHRPTRLLISQQAIAHNLAVVRQVSGCRTIFMAVKDNAYGFGLLPVSRAVLASGAQGLAVAVLDEALVLRAAGIKAPILIMSLLDAQYAQACADQQVIVTVASLTWLQKAQHNLTGTAPLLVSLGLDTGMGRIGYRDRAEIEESIRFLQQHSTQFTYQGLMTHFADSDTVETDYFHRQVRPHRWPAPAAHGPRGQLRRGDVSRRGSSHRYHSDRDRGLRDGTLRGHDAARQLFEPDRTVGIRIDHGQARTRR